MPYDLAEVSLKTGISQEKLQKEVSNMVALQELGALFASEGQKVALIGGTALNKIYYGKDQRISYDLDIESFTFEKSFALLKKVSETKVAHSISSRFVYKGVIIDLMRARKMEEPRLRKVESLLSFFNYPMGSLLVQSYSLDFLLARKTAALLARMVAKDVYDTWMGLKILKDTKTYKSYMKRIARADKMNLDYLIAQFSYLYKSGNMRYSVESIDVIRPVNFKIMVGDILLKLKSIFM